MLIVYLLVFLRFSAPHISNFLFKMKIHKCFKRRTSLPFISFIHNKIGNHFTGTWEFQETKNGSSRFPDFRKSNGQSVFELVSSPTKISGVHYVQVSYTPIFGVH